MDRALRRTRHEVGKAETQYAEGPISYAVNGPPPPVQKWNEASGLEKP